MKERVKNVLNFKKYSRVVIIVSVALAAVLSVGFAVNRKDDIFPMSMNSVHKEPHFAGAVMEVYDKSILVKVNDDEDIARSSDLISVSLDVKLKGSHKHFIVGDEVIVYYNGEIAESYPAQIFTVYAIVLTSPDMHINIDEAPRAMTLDDVITLSQKGDALVMEDFKPYIGEDVGSGLYIMHYDLGNGFTLEVGSGSMTGKPMYAMLSQVGRSLSIDIRYDDVGAFVQTGDWASNEDNEELIQGIEDSLRTIMSSPLTSSNPQDYINEHWEEYENLTMKYTEGVLDYLLSQFEAGNSSGLRGHIMMRICKDILGVQNNVADETLSPQEWYKQLSIINETKLPDFKPEHPADEHSGLVYSAIIQHYSNPNDGFMVAAPTIYGAYEEKDKLKIFVTVYYERYRLYGKTLENRGGAVTPGAIVFQKDNNSGEWVFKEYIEVGTANLLDGMYFNESIQKLCVMPESEKEIEGLAEDMSKDYTNDARQELLMKNLNEHLTAQGQLGVTLQ